VVVRIKISKFDRQYIGLRDNVKRFSPVLFLHLNYVVAKPIFSCYFI
jgi:hypothetical protein